MSTGLWPATAALIDLARMTLNSMMFERFMSNVQMSLPRLPGIMAREARRRCGGDNEAQYWNSLRMGCRVIRRNMAGLYLVISHTSMEVSSVHFIARKGPSMW